MLSPGKMTGAMRRAARFFRNTRNTLETAWLRPRYDGYMRFQDHAGDIIHQCLRGETDIETALHRLQENYLESRA